MTVKQKHEDPTHGGAFDGKGWLPRGFLFKGMLLFSLRLLRMPDFRNLDMKPEASEKGDLRLKRGACSRHLSSSFLLEAHVRKRVGSCSCKGLGLQAQGCEGISVDHEPELLPFSGCCGSDVLWQGMCWVKDPYDHEALNSLTSSHLPSKTLSSSSGSLVTNTL